MIRPLLTVGRIVLVGVAKSHSAITSGNIKDVWLRDEHEKVVTGKHKRIAGVRVVDGATTVEERTIIAEITMEDGKVFKVRAGIKGKLLEMNDGLVKDRSLLKSSVWFPRCDLWW